MKALRSPALQAVLAAALYAINIPCAKLLLVQFSPMIMATLLYLGASIGMFIIGLIRKGLGHGEEMQLSCNDLPYVIGIIALDIAAPILLMVGLQMTTASNAALLNNFEIVATSLIALLLFRERISIRMWFAIGLMTLASAMLSFEDASSFSFSVGSLLVLFACVCWGFDNNCTRRLSGKDPLQIVVVKGLGSGAGAFLITLVTGERVTQWQYVPLALLLGFVAYGLSAFFYVRAQRHLGAARTSAYYTIAPFLGAGFSLVLFCEIPNAVFLIALALMAVGTVMVTLDHRENTKTALVDIEMTDRR